nr:MAG TPA: hypothetical protein [Caudoviricetes sp.]
MVALTVFWLKYRGIGVFWVGEEEKDRRLEACFRSPRSPASPPRNDPCLDRIRRCGPARSARARG